MLRFKHFCQLDEHILNIGLNPSHEKYREQHKSEFHDILHNSYKKIGGYGGHESGSKEESEAIHNDIANPNHIIKATKRAGKITSLNVYKKSHGRKSIGVGTDGTDQGKKDFVKTKIEDDQHKRAWGEVSGAVEKIQHRIGTPLIPSSKAAILLGKEVKPVGNDPHRYTRKIGDHDHEKVMMGHPKD